MQPVVLRRAAPGRAQHAGGVRVVNCYDRVVLIGELEHVWQLADISLHREHAVGDDEPVAGALRVPERLLERLHVRVFIDLPGRFDHADAVDDRGMIELIRDERVLRAEEGRHQAGIRVPARHVGERRLQPQEISDLLFELSVDGERAADEANR